MKIKLEIGGRKAKYAEFGNVLDFSTNNFSDSEETTWPHVIAKTCDLLRTLGYSIVNNDLILDALEDAKYKARNTNG